MAWLMRFFNSSVGMKMVVALTGLGLAGFVVGHLSGNLLVYVGPEAINAYAEGLHDLGPLLWVIRGGLLAVFVVHIVFTVRLKRANAAARPAGYQHESTVQASWASRYMIYSGLLVLAFVIYHLMHYTFRVVGLGGYQLQSQFDLYGMIVAGFNQPLISAFYIFCLVLLGLHINHGLSSVFQSLGLAHSKYRRIIRYVGPVASVVLMGGFISIPIAVMVGIVG